MISCPHNTDLEEEARDEMEYHAIPRRYRAEDGTEYTGYDIVGLEAEREPLLAEDVTEDGALARALCARMNREGLEAVHFQDVIFDFLCDGEAKNSLLSG